MPGEVPARRSLLFRLLAGSVLICVLAVAATAWLVVRSATTTAEQSIQTLASDRLVYRTLLRYAETHDSWDGVGDTLDRLSTRTGYRVILTDGSATPIADSWAPEPGAAPDDISSARTLVDPGDIDRFLAGDAQPTAPPTGEPSAEPRPSPALAPTAGCDGCTAPPAYLFLSPLPVTATTTFDLGRHGLQAALIAGGVVLFAIALSIVVGRGLTGPLRALTASASRMGGGDTAVRVEVRGSDEIAALGTAFNAMAEARQEQEAGRRAMISDIAHELRTPLANIRGHVEAAQDRVLDLDDALLTSLHDEALVLQHVIDDLQVLALSDAGALRLEHATVDIGETIDQAVSALGPAASSAGVTLRAEHPPDLVTQADPVRIRQVIANLTANAITHTPPGGRVTVTGRTDDDVVVTVRDTRSGLSADQLAHVFERFWRADPARTRSTGGSGLGLAIVKSVVELHAGSVSAESVPAAGSTFVVRIPLVR